MLPWPGVEVEAGKRGGIKEVFAGEPLRPIFRSREMPIVGSCLRTSMTSLDGIGKGWLWHVYFFKI